MKEIVYKFCDGSVDKVLVEDSFYEKYMKLAHEEYKNERNEMLKHHQSLEEMEENNIEIKADIDVLEEIIKKEDLDVILAKVRQLSYEKKQIIYKYFFLNENQQKIADDLGVSQQAISKFLNSFFNLFGCKN